MVPSLSADVNARFVDVLACFWETIKNAMAGKWCESGLYSFVDELLKTQKYPTKINDLKARGI